MRLSFIIWCIRPSGSVDMNAICYNVSQWEVQLLFDNFLLELIFLFFSQYVCPGFDLVFFLQMSQALLGLCCLIETRDRIEIISITAVLFE